MPMSNMPASRESSFLGAATERGRASWSGLLKLSLVAVPVKAYPAAASSQDVRSHWLHAGCGQRIRYEKHCPVHGKVDTGAIVSGYQRGPEQYVVLDEAELDKLRPAKERALALEHIIDAYHVDPLLFSGRSLYLLPDGLAAQQPYLVLCQALRERGKWAVGRVVLSGHRHLVLVRPAGEVLGLHVLHFPSQLKSSAGLEPQLSQAAIGPEESRLASLLLDTCSSSVPWSSYRDDRADQIRRLIDAKLRGQPLQEPATQEAPILPLVQALKQSVAAAQTQAAAKQGKGRKTASGRSA
jgi:DNA end-binding protein Ku